MPRPDVERAPSLHPFIIWGQHLESSKLSLTGKIAVVIDNLAATSNISRLLFAEPKELYVVNDQTLLQKKAEYPDAIFIGESNNPAHQGVFRFSNVPGELEKQRAFTIVKNQVCIIRTNNGTRTLEQAFSHGANMVLAASFLNYAWIIRFIEKQDKPVVIIPSGEQGFGENWQTAEDRLGAETLEKAFRHQHIDFFDLKEQVKNGILLEYTPNYLEAGRSLTQLKRDIELITRFNVINSVPVCHKIHDGFIEIVNMAEPA